MASTRPERDSCDRLRVAVQHVGTTRVVTLWGDLDRDGGRTLRRVFSEHDTDGGELVAFDLGRVKSADGSGLRVLAKLVDHVRRRGQQTAVVSPSADVIGAMQRAGVADSLPVAVERGRRGEHPQRRGRPRR